MHSDLESLANLRDIVTPPLVSWWPLAPGWWFLFSVLVAVAVLVAAQRWRRWQAAAYRRAALRELHSADSVELIAELLKRTALAASPRPQVASLTGSAWVKWLAETGGGPVPAAVSQALTFGVYAESYNADASELAAFSAQWIRSHQIGKDMKKESKPDA
jgi:hypothetical protein